MKRSREGKLGALRLRRVRRITAGQVHHRAPSWSRDGRFVACALGEGLDSFWVVLDRKGRVARVLEGPVDGTASFAADGSLAYGRQVGATSEIWLLPALAESPRRFLGGDGRFYRDPAYSPDGRHLAYVADDGAEPGSPLALRLWQHDLARDQPLLLLDKVPAAPVASDENQPLRLGHPAWSPTGDRLYFDASDGLGSSIYSLELATAQLVRVTEPGHRRPAPLASGLLLCERASSDGKSGGDSELVLLDHRHGAAPRSVALWGLGAREAALVYRKRSWQLCWAMPCRAAADEPSRYDLHVAELLGLPLPAPREEPAAP